MTFCTHTHTVIHTHKDFIPNYHNLLVFQCVNTPCPHTDFRIYSRTRSPCLNISTEHTHTHFPASLRPLCFIQELFEKAFLSGDAESLLGRMEVPLPYLACLGVLNTCRYIDRSSEPLEHQNTKGHYVEQRVTSVLTVHTSCNCECVTDQFQQNIAQV